MDKKTFEAYSHYYDLLYKDKDYAGEADYIHSLIKQFSPKATTILELGCGTGIHASILAEKGYKIEGIDKSEAMLKRALELQSELPLPVSQKLSFLEGDIRTYKSALKFDAVISLFHVMSYMTTNEDLNLAIQTAKKHLKHDGIFIFDCWYGPGVMFDKPISRVKTFENNSVSINRTSIPKIYPDKHIVDVTFEISIHDKLKNENMKLHELHSMRYLFTDELHSLMKINGLEIIHAEEWMTKKTLAENCWSACYVCKNNL